MRSKQLIGISFVVATALAVCEVYRDKGTAFFW
jgi:hypothetical protein